MENLLAKSQRLLASVNYQHQRNLLRDINWQWRLNGIVGARGTGKTTFIGVHRNTLIQYLRYLDKARLVRLLTLQDKDISVLQKPDKVFLDNTNLQYALQPTQWDVGNMRETFFASQLSPQHELHLHRQADFIIDHQHIVEVGGKNKSHQQIANLSDAYLAVDDLEVGYGNRIPLWLFGMLY